MTKLEEIVRHYNFKWPNDKVDRLYYWYFGMYSSKAPTKMPYCQSYSRNEFESWVKQNEKSKFSNLD